MFILPKKASPGARVITLRNPRNARPTRYLVCPDSGFYEFTRVAVSKSTPRSWLLESSEEASFEAQITKSADLFIASPIDPLFLILPALTKTCITKLDNSRKQMFLSSGDHLESMLEQDSHLSALMSWDSVRRNLEARMAAVCETIEIGDDPMYRFDEGKLLEEMLSKARRMSDHGLPKSMEEKFVSKVLEAPIKSIRSKASTVPPLQQLESSASTDSRTAGQQPELESRSSVAALSSTATSSSSPSDAPTASTSVADAQEAYEVMSAMRASDEIAQLQRLRIAFNFICSTYICPPVAERLKSALTSSQATDFQPLDEYLEKLAKVKQEATAARESDFSQKRMRDEEDDERAEKRRKTLEEEKRKKASESRGIRELKKVNTKGMMKLSEFFKKK